MIGKSSLRKRLLKERLEMSQAERKAAQEKISCDLKRLLTPFSGPLGFYLPVKGEFNPVEVVEDWLRIDKKNTACLPVIVKKDEPMIFRKWTPKQIMVKGTFDIDIPDSKSPIIEPKILLIPTLGFNQKNFRLGYGGGYYDRTLTVISALTIGICFKIGKSSEIEEEDHDIPLDIIIAG